MPRKTPAKPRPKPRHKAERENPEGTNFMERAEIAFTETLDSPLITDSLLDTPGALSALKLAFLDGLLFGNARAIEAVTAIDRKSKNHYRATHAARQKIITFPAPDDDPADAS